MLFDLLLGTKKLVDPQQVKLRLEMKLVALPSPLWLLSMYLDFIRFSIFVISLTRAKT
uniref:Uncharacterized protein n=1 Tax=Picea glauca TaxID=3330 RepID=A0A101LVA1_PICGL|nr:hypothetical protein ABT39_MTgene2078 [Picea glauca]QHR87104.1 hypothetical protein Q903MT_gene1113 [Picea sitchensis]